MPDVTDEDLREEIAKVLKNADLAKTSTNKVIQKLEESLGTELAAKKSIIDKMVLDYVNSQASEDDDEDEDEEEAAVKDEEEEVEEETKKKPAKASKRPKKARKAASDEDEESNDSEYEKPAKRAAATNKRGKKAKPRKGTSDEDDDDDDNDSEYEYKEKKAKPKKAAAKGKKAGAKGGGRGKGGGYTRAYRLSPALAALMGAPEMPRHEVVKRVWAIIKEKQLYDPSNKQFAICDDALYKVIGTKRFRIFGMMKYLTSHFIDG